MAEMHTLGRGTPTPARPLGAARQGSEELDEAH